MRVLCAVVAGGSVTAAAARLGYTPSAVSQQVAALERQTGTVLLERAGRGIRPTAAGRLLAEHAVLIGRQIAEAETALADLRAGRTGRLVVRYAAGCGAPLVAPALARLRAAHPEVRIDIAPDIAVGDDALADVARGLVDLAVVADAPGLPGPAGGVHGVPEGVRLEHLLDDPYRALLPAGHPLAARRVVDLAELAREPWIVSAAPGPGPARRPYPYTAAGTAPDVVVGGEDHATVQSLVAAGLGVAIAPALGLGARHPGIAVRRIRGPEPVRPLRAAVRSAPGGHPALLLLLDALRGTGTGTEPGPPGVPRAARAG
ncbi:LysR family transcriptional regulator [Streptomyces sp. NPDC006798]|uniref:LysR family transcriptional regulator n=1 Tax=Streptomyces sp. NPDC006798 TaxID=3155462 RepID=UPI0033DFAA50